MATVNCVLGSIDTSCLGVTLTHEHILTSSAGFRYTYPELLNRPGVEEAAVKALTIAKGEGVRTIVDCTTMDLDRDVRLLEVASRRSGVNIICSTGSHLFIPHTFFQTVFQGMENMSSDKVASLWVREIKEGIEGTGIRAGVIKVATNDPISEAEELMLRAAAKAQQQTGVPITTHTPHSSRIGEEQIRILEMEGADPGKVYIGHVNSTLDHDYHINMLKKGVWLGMDEFRPGGPPATPNWRDRSKFIANLIYEGYEGSIMLSHDWSVRRIASADEFPDAEPNPDGYSWIQRGILPFFRELGVSESSIKSMMVDNPKRFLEGVGP